MVVIRNGQAHLIDFQGMRPGLAEYDLASLLYDPYVDLPESERAELTAYYRDRQGENVIAINGDFDFKLRLCAMQRLMQALGAYGFLGLVKGHKHFLQYVPNALGSLRTVAAKIENLQPLASFLAEVASRVAQHIERSTHPLACSSLSQQEEARPRHSDVKK